MSDRIYTWRDDAGEHELRLVHVPGTHGSAYDFGSGDRRIPIDIRDFHVGTTQVTQALWQHVMGENPARHSGPNHPMENVSWEHITQPGGFLERINASLVLAAVRGNTDLRFRLPSETEWEYAARGGPRWRDGFAFSGSNDPDEVAWYGPRWTPFLRKCVRVFGWRFTWYHIANLPHTNWDLHCTVSWRYGIIPDAHDGCLGFRVVLA